MCRGGLVFSGYDLVGRWIDGLGLCPRVFVGMRVCRILITALCCCRLTHSRIVEYATRDQAQQAVSTLSNQNLMGRLVYVREVRPTLKMISSKLLSKLKT